MSLVRQLEEQDTLVDEMTAKLREATDALNRACDLVEAERSLRFDAFVAGFMLSAGEVLAALAPARAEVQQRERLREEYAGWLEEQKRRRRDRRETA